ncbi:hypothetical protein ACFPM7_06610 [Actinokineospora guangxiensis]|uniref:Uncharacterized protein n=1 Tax=Actinokineospora guangxiensis TaxID=1490288 RepID=A0ABW0EID5_9PSEU
MPEPFLISIAAALAGRGASSLYELVKTKLANRPAATAALESAKGKPADSPEVVVLADHLQQATAEEPGFRDQLTATWNASKVDQTASSGGVTNTISGDISGSALQTRDINGNVSFGG